MGFLKSLFGGGSPALLDIISNLSSHVPNVVENWFKMSIKSFQKQIHNKSEIINHVKSEDLEFFIKAYYCFCTASVIGSSVINIMYLIFGYSFF